MYEIKEINTIDEKQISECVEIMWRTQGINVSSIESFKWAATSPDALLLMAFDQGKVIGGAIGKVQDKDFDYYSPFGDEIVPKLLASKVGSLSIMGIDENYQGKGIGQQLSRKRIDWLKDKGCNVLIGISWVSGQLHTSNRVFEKMGFTAIKTIDQFFAESSIPMNLICPVCGVPPCLCAGTLYMKIL